MPLSQQRFCKAAVSVFSRFHVWFIIFFGESVVLFLLKVARDESSCPSCRDSSTLWQPVPMHHGKASHLGDKTSVVCGAPCGYTACIGVPQYLCHESIALVTMASVFSCGIWKGNVTVRLHKREGGQECSGVVLPLAHVAKELGHAFRPADSQQHVVVAQQNLQGHKHQDFTGPTDDLVPHPKNKASAYFTSEIM